MKRVLFFILMFSISACLVAENNDELLKQKHMKSIYFFGDTLVLEGDHHFEKKVSVSNTTQVYSIYRKDDFISRFCVRENYELYNTVQLIVEENSIVFQTTNKITTNYNTQTIKYDLSFEKTNNSVTCNVKMDKEASLLEEGDEIWDLIIQCVFDHGLPLLPQFMECLELPDIPSKRECIWPLAETEEFMNVLQCILDGMEPQNLRSTYWRIFTKTQGMGFVSIKPFGSKDECSTQTGCTHFAIPSGHKVNINATSAPGYKFEYWEFKGNLLSLDAEYSFVPSSGGDLIAHFSKEN